MNNTKIRMFASPAAWIEGEAVRQLEQVAELNGMVQVVGLPDLHVSKGAPVGAAMLTDGVLFPYLVGSDVGCGMTLSRTEIPCEKARPEKWFKKLRHLESRWEGNCAAWLEERGVQQEFLSSVGTIGHGNHFAELLRMHEVHDADAVESLALDRNVLYLLVHSGSRGLGEMLLRDHIAAHQSGSLDAGSRAARTYLSRHDSAVRWADANRELISYRLLEQLGSGYTTIVSLCHNSVTRLDGDGAGRFLHRKGAAPSTESMVIVPGSRGSLSYLVKPTGCQEKNLWSVPHGAGRKWRRSECKGRLRDRYSKDSFVRTKQGSFVICEDADLLYEEAPQAYKDIDLVVQEMAAYGVISLIASFRPLLTYKGRES